MTTPGTAWRSGWSSGPPPARCVGSSPGAGRGSGCPEEVLTDNGKVFTGRFALRPMEVLFDRICRENGITHRLTAPRSPTTTGKIERFHGTLRREFLDGKTLRLAAGRATGHRRVDRRVQHRPAAPVAASTDPGRGVRRRRPDPGPPLSLAALAAPVRDGDDWISRRVAANGVICVAYQQFSVGKHRAGEVVDVHLTPRLLEIWDRNALLKTVVRTSEGQVRKKRASKPADQLTTTGVKHPPRRNRQPSTEPGQPHPQ